MGLSGSEHWIVPQGRSQERGKWEGRRGKIVLHPASSGCFGVCGFSVLVAIWWSQHKHSDCILVVGSVRETSHQSFECPYIRRFSCSSGIKS